MEEEENEKRPMVVSAYAVADPKAVMIISLYADLAFSAVPCSIVTQNVAFLTSLSLRLVHNQSALF